MHLTQISLYSGTATDPNHHSVRASSCLGVKELKGERREVGIECAAHPCACAGSYVARAHTRPPACAHTVVLDGEAQIRALGEQATKRPPKLKLPVELLTVGKPAHAREASAHGWAREAALRRIAECA